MRKKIRIGLVSCSFAHSPGFTWNYRIRLRDGLCYGCVEPFDILFGDLALSEKEWFQLHTAQVEW